MSEGESARPVRPGGAGDAVADTVEGPDDRNDLTVAIPGGSARAPQPETLLGQLRRTDPDLLQAALPPLPASAYEIGPEVARGGMGRVVRAIDHRLGRVVALKLLLGDSPDLRARFAREAQITAGLQHPSIVPIYEAGTWPDGNLAYAMKLVSGESLEQAITACGSLEERLALLPRFIDVVDAVAYAHSQRVVHRDIKPSNIILGEFGETILIDWGVAKSLDGEEEAAALGLPVDSEASRLTALGAVVGTPVYMPPEQAAGDSIDDRADVYSLGAVLYQLLAGRLPYTGATPLAVLRKVALGPPPALESVDRHIPAELAAVVARAMARERADRYSAGELAAELRRFTTGKLVAAYHYTARERLWRWVRRHRAAVSVVAAALAVLVAVAAVSARRIVRERDRARALVADQYAEQGRVRLLAGDRLRSLAYLFEAARAGARGPAVDFMLAQAARAVEQKRHDLVGHKGPLVSIAFDPAGRRLVTAGDDGTARVWDPASGRMLAVLTGHQGPLHGAALSADGGRLLTFGEDGTARVFDLASGRQLHHMTGGEAPLTAARYSADGALIATAAADGTVRIFDSESGRQSASLQAHTAIARDVRFAADGRLWTCGDDGDVAVWQLDGRPVRRFALGRGRAVGLATAGWQVAALLTGGAAAVWTTGEGEPRLLELGEDLDTTIRTSRPPLFADGGTRLVVPVNRAVQVIDLAGGRRLFSLVGHTGIISAVALSADGQRVATASADGAARIWSAADGRLLSILQSVDHVQAVAFSPAADRVATAGFAGAVVWAPVEDPPSRRLLGHRGVVYSVRFDATGARAVSAGNDRTVRIWDVASGRQLAVGHHSAEVTFAAFDPGGRRIVVGDQHGVASLWRADPLVREAVLEPAANEPVMAVAFAADGSAIAASSDDGTARVWDARTRAVIATLRHAGEVNAIDLDAAGERVLTATQRGVARVWDVRSGRELVAVQVDGPVAAASFSPDGRHFMVAARRAARIFDARTGAIAASLDGHQREVGAVRFGPGGLAVTGGADHLVKVWDALNGRELASFDGHAAWLFSVDVDRDGRRVVSGDVDGAIIVRDLAQRSEATAALEARLGERVPFRISGGVLVPRRLH